MSGHSSTLFIQSVVIFHHVCLRCNTVQFQINKPFLSIINMSWFKLLLLLTSPYTKVQIVYKIGHWVVNYDWLLSVKAHSGGWKLLRFCLRMRHTVAVQLIKTFSIFCDNAHVCRTRTRQTHVVWMDLKIVHCLFCMFFWLLSRLPIYLPKSYPFNVTRCWSEKSPDCF